MLLRTIVFFALCTSSAWAWNVEDRTHEEFPGRAIEISYEGKRVAELIYGEAQFKPFLHVYDAAGHRLTNSGIESDGELRGRFPHHRGIFIGWNRIRTDLGMDDLWHLRNGEQMKLISIETKETSDNSATLVVLIHWLSAKQEGGEGGLLLEERRTIEISRANGRTRIDHHSELTAARDLVLGGDLQHAGLHFRADAAVDEVREQTKYLWAPADLPPGNGRIVSDELQWVNFRFPLHGQWSSVTQLNPPENRATELSWRDYGRFGFFFQESLQKGETRKVAARFLIDTVSASDADQKIRATAQRDYWQHLRELN